MFIAVLGEVASALALMSAEPEAVVPAAEVPVAAPASVALVDGAAASVDELIALPEAELEALLSMVLPVCVSLAIGLAVSPMPDCALVDVEEFG
ncbi:hypothetical protein [Novosphingobium sp. 9U]|uniref:hypothetical protein n=1 Tax=Novosphingobium sp. 9U TaxID=2653158 RepID=UPI0012F4408D|nr:hypothetical protein [Novosphingobium sp. 9U]VWX47049.1 hypothetical protein NOVOSPHI9U_10481 [Novosphingobium sp. 9U]